MDEFEGPPADVWDRRFRRAATACLVAAAVLVVTGFIAGAAFDPPKPEFSGSSSDFVSMGSTGHQEFFARADLFLSGANVISAVLVLLAVLLSVVAGTGADGEQAYGTVLGLVIVLVAAARVGLAFWYFVVADWPGGDVSRLMQDLGAPVAALTIAAGAGWWAWRNPAA